METVIDIIFVVVGYGGYSFFWQHPNPKIRARIERSTNLVPLLFLILYFFAPELEGTAYEAVGHFYITHFECLAFGVILSGFMRACSDFKSVLNYFDGK